ncbi:substrate-binding domain-containing protein [Streptomyces sp. M10(2022)]
MHRPVAGRPSREDGAEGGLLQVNGSPTDAAAGLIKKGIHKAVDDSGFELLAEYDTPDWSPEKAQQWTSGQIAQYPGRIAGVVAANDGTGVERSRPSRAPR